MAFDVPSGAGSPHSAVLYPADTANRLDTLLVLAHGAGAGQSHPFMVRYARGLAERGLDVLTFNFPYMDARRKSPDRAPVLEDAFRRVVSGAAAHRHVRAGRLLIGGKSMGGRMATHLAAAPETWPSDAPALDGVIALGYPLKAGEERSRVAPVQDHRPDPHRPGHARQLRRTRRRPGGPRRTSAYDPDTPGADRRPLVRRSEVERANPGTSRPGDLGRDCRVAKP